MLQNDEHICHLQRPGTGGVLAEAREERAETGLLGHHQLHVTAPGTITI